MPQCQFHVFCYFCVLEKLHRKHSRNWTKQKPKFLFSRHETESKAETEGSQGPATPWGGTGQPLAVPPGGRATWPTSERRPSAYIFSSARKPKSPDQFSSKHTASRLWSMRDREGPEAVPITLPERGITTGGLLHHHACLQSDA
jgi:hypothetical protein